MSLHEMQAYPFATGRKGVLGMLKIAVLSISALIISFVSVSGVFPALAADLGVTQMQSELMMTIPALAVIIFIFISNVVVEKIGIKKTVILGLLVSGVGGVFPTFVQSFTPILISRFFLGAGVGLVNTWAVRYITLLFDEKESAKLMGFRSSAEIGCQTVVAAVAGFLFRWGWQMSFLAYGIAFVSATLVLIVVPEVKLPKSEHDETGKVKLPVAVYLLAAFATLVVVTAASIAFRFPALAIEAQDSGYNPNMMMTLWPILSIFAAVTYGKLSELLGKKFLYLALFILIVAAFFTGFSNGNYVMLVIGLFLHGVAPAWFFPFIFMTASKMTTGKEQSMAFSYIVIGIKLGVFLIPFVVNLIETVLGNNALTVPYPVLGSLLIVATLFIATVGKKIVRNAYINEN